MRRKSVLKGPFLEIGDESLFIRRIFLGIGLLLVLGGLIFDQDVPIVGGMCFMGSVCWMRIRDA